MFFVLGVDFWVMLNINNYDFHTEFLGMFVLITCVKFA